MTNVFRSRESTLINCFLMLNAFHVEDFLRVAAASVTGTSPFAIRPSSFAGETMLGELPCGGSSSASVASIAGDAAREELLLPSYGLLVGVLWGLAEISVN